MESRKSGGERAVVGAADSPRASPRSPWTTSPKCASHAIYGPALKPPGQERTVAAEHKPRPCHGPHMAAYHERELPTLDVPADDLARRARDHPLAIGRRRHAAHGMAVAIESRDRPPIGLLPHRDNLLAGPRDSRVMSPARLMCARRTFQHRWIVAYCQLQFTPRTSPSRYQATRTPLRLCSQVTVVTRPRLRAGTDIFLPVSRVLSREGPILIQPLGDSPRL